MIKELRDTLHGSFDIIGSSHYELNDIFPPCALINVVQLYVIQFVSYLIYLYLNAIPVPICIILLCICLCKYEIKYDIVIIRIMHFPLTYNLFSINVRCAITSEMRVESLFTMPPMDCCILIGTLWGKASHCPPQDLCRTTHNDKSWDGQSQQAQPSATVLCRW